MLTKKKKSGLFCISFDAVPLSGVIVEFLKIAEIFHKNDYSIYLDLGYEVKSDKKNFFKDYTHEKNIFPSWIHLVKTLDQPYKSYSENLVEKILGYVVKDSTEIKQYAQLIDDYSDFIANKLIRLWHKLNIKLVIVENGTLPENIIFTKALYKAIDYYGYEQDLSKYVLWRDHDLMWSSEANINKYGKSPYPNVPKLKPSPHISYVVLHNSDYKKTVEWSPNVSVTILRNSFNPPRFDSTRVTKEKNIRKKFRSLYNIPEDAYLIARFTRIIPQKRIDRDIQLLHFFHNQCKTPKKTYLIIAGDSNENPDEFDTLQKLVNHFGLETYVIFVGTLKPINFHRDNDIKNIQSLILASDICSFLTSYHYESFGNPISEAICLGRAYITTSYKRYQHVYGDLNYQGLIFSISENQDGPIDRNFASKVYELLSNENEIKNMVKHNIEIIKNQQSNEIFLTKQLNQLFNLDLT